MNWNWTEKEKEALDRVVVSTAAEGDLVLAVANKAAELLAARGGTMRAESLAKALRWTLQDPPGEQATVALHEHISAQGACIAAMEQQRRLDMEHEELTRREIGALPGETVMGAARRLFQERKTLEAERDTLSQRLTETNQRAQENYDRQEAERERLRNELGAALVRAGQAEARVRQLAIAGQELSAAVDRRIGESQCANPDPVTGPTCAERGCEGQTCRYPKTKSPVCTHDDAATPGHPERVKERSEAFNKAAAGMDFHMGYESGAEAMRAACWEAVQRVGHTIPFAPAEMEMLKAAIEGAAP